MPIRRLEVVKKSINHKSYCKVPAKVLKENTVCIDGYWFLRKYMTNCNVHEIFINKMEKRYITPVVKLINMAKKCNFQILWLWDGMDYERPQVGIGKNEEILLRQGYEYYAKGDYVNSNKRWRSIIDQDYIVNDINLLLKQYKHEAFTAPYSSTAQIAYFIKNNIFSYGFGKTDLLIYDGVDKVISDIYFDNYDDFSVEITNKKSICEAFDIDYCDFKSFAFASGCEYCPTIPEYADNIIPENIITIIKTEGIENFLLKSLKKNQEETLKYMDYFYKAFVLVTYHPVMKEDGKVSPLFTENIPCDLHLLFGKMLPDALYSYLFENRLSPEILESFARGLFKTTNIDEMGIADTLFGILQEKVNLKVKTANDLNVGKKIEIDSSTSYRSQFFSIITPGMVLSDDLDAMTQVILYKASECGILKNSFLPKILCFGDSFEQDVELQNNNKEGYKFDYETLEFYWKSMKIIKLIKQMKEAFEIVTSTKLDVSFKPNISIYNGLYFEKNKKLTNDSNIKNAKLFLNYLCKFFRSNHKVDKNFIQIEKEITGYLRN